MTHFISGLEYPYKTVITQYPKAICPQLGALRTPLEHPRVQLVFLVPYILSGQCTLSTAVMILLISCLPPSFAESAVL